MSKASKAKLSDAPQTGVRGSESRRSGMIPTMVAAQAAAGGLANAGDGTPVSASSAKGGAGGMSDEKKDIWTLVIDHLNDEKRKADTSSAAATAAKPDDKSGADGSNAAVTSADNKDNKDNKRASIREAAFIVVGAAGAGKTSLLATYIPSKDEQTAFAKPGGYAGWVPTPTTALEYRYARLPSSLGNEKDVGHFWELGGGRSMVKLLDMCLTVDNIRDMLAIVVVDLSKPSRVVDDINYWLDQLRSRAEACWDKLRAAKSDIPARMAAAAKAQFDSKEFDKLNVFALPTLIVASKYDVLAARDPEAVKIMSRTLRAIAHTNGCGLLYTTVRGGGATGDQTVKWWLSRLNRHAGNKGPSTTVQLEARGPLSVPAGTDSFAKIEKPKEASATTTSTAAGFVSAWINSFNSMFPKTAADATDETVVSTTDLKLTEEPLLDPILAQKNDDLKKFQHDAQLRRKLKQVDAEAAANKRF